jgi:hypothetical protein
MDCALITLASGTSAQNLRELRDRLLDAPASSIYHHFHESVLRPSFDDPEYRNDFALWARRNLRDIVLSERLAAVDPQEYPDTEDLRQALIEILEERLSEVAHIPWVPEGEEFHFLRSQVVLFDTGLRPATPTELAARVPSLSTSSIFFHFVEARRREPIGVDDFSAWLSDWGREHDDLRYRLAGIDYYLWSLARVRELVVRAFEETLRKGRS